MTDREVMQMALDALEIYGAQAPAVKDTINALRKALAAPQPAGVYTESLIPVVQWLEAGCDPKHAATELRLLSKAAPQPAQEPDYNICPSCGGMASDPIVPHSERFPQAQRQPL